MDNEKENKGALRVTSQEPTTARKPLKLNKDPNGNPQAESQTLGNDSSKVQGRRVGSDSSFRNKSPQAVNATKEDSSTNLNNDQPMSYEEEVDNGPNKVKPRPRPESGKNKKDFQEEK